MPAKRNLEIQLSVKDKATRDIKKFTRDTSRSVKDMGKDVGRVSRDMGNSWKNTSETIKVLGTSVSNVAGQIKTSTAGMSTNMNAYATSTQTASAATGALSTNTNTASKNTETLRTRMQDYSKAADKSVRSIQDLGGRVSKVSTGSRTIAAGMNNFSKSAGMASKATEQVNKSVKATGRNMAKLPKQMSGYSKSAKTASTATNNIARASNDVAKSNSRMLKTMSAYVNKARNAGKELKGLSGSLKGLGDIKISGTFGALAGAAGRGILSTLAAIGIAGAALFKTVKMVSNLGIKLVKAGAGWKDLINSLRIAAGSHKTVDRVMGNLQKTFGANKKAVDGLTKSNQRLAKSQEKVAKSTKGTAKSTKAATKTVGGLVAGLGKMRAGWLVAGAAVAAFVVGFKKFLDVGERGAVIEQQAEAFKRFAAASGDASDQIIKNLKRMSAGMIDTASLVRKAGTAMLLGVDPSKLSDLMEIARATAKLTGQTVSDAFGDISLAVARQSKMILDNLGIIVSLEEAYANYAKQIGKTASALSDVEKKQAFLNETIRKGKLAVDRIGDSAITNAEKFQMFGASIKNLIDELSRKLAGPGAAISGWLAKLTNNITESLVAQRERSAEIIPIQRQILDLQESIVEATDELKQSYVEFGQYTRADLETMKEKYAQLILLQQTEREHEELILSINRTIVQTEEALAEAKKQTLVYQERSKELAIESAETQRQLLIDFLQMTEQTAKAEVMIVQDKYNKMLQAADNNRQLTLAVYRNMIVELERLLSKFKPFSEQHRLVQKEIDIIKRKYNELARDGGRSLSKIEDLVRGLSRTQEGLTDSVEETTSAYKDLGAAGSAAASAVDAGVSQIQTKISAIQPMSIDVDLNTTPAMGAIEFLEQEAHNRLAGALAEYATNIAYYTAAERAGLTGTTWSLLKQRQLDQAKITSIIDYYDLALRQLGSQFNAPGPTELYSGRPYWQIAGAQQPQVSAPGPSFPSFHAGTGSQGLPRSGLFFGEKGEVVLNKEDSGDYRRGREINVTISPMFMTGDKKSMKKAAEMIRNELKYETVRRS